MIGEMCEKELSGHDYQRDQPASEQFGTSILYLYCVLALCYSFRSYLYDLLALPPNLLLKRHQETVNLLHGLQLAKVVHRRDWLYVATQNGH